MLARHTLGVLGFAGAAIGGAALGWLAERRTLPSVHLHADPEWRALQRGVEGRGETVVSFDGTPLHLEATGPATAPTLVLVHGYGLGMRSWYYQRRDLSDDFRVVAYDQRGHGRSGVPASRDYSIVALARDLEVVLDRVAGEGQPVVVVGHSLGGMAILAWAGRYPQQVQARLAGAVLLDTTGSDVLAGGLAATSIAALQALQRRVVGTLVRRLPDDGSLAPADLPSLLGRACAFAAGASPTHVAYVEELLLDCPNGVKAALGPTLTSVDLRHAAPLLTVPTLVLVGAEDKLTPPASARRLAASLPDARTVEIAGAGHNPMIEAHATVTARLRDFALRTLRQSDTAARP